MFKSSRLALMLLGALAIAAPLHAADFQKFQSNRVKAALNDMVRAVEHARTPAEKREVMDRFLGRAETGLAVAGSIPFLGKEKHAAAVTLGKKFAGYEADLHGKDGHAAVADGELNAYASFMQQDIEQAEASWGNGGIYLSTGAVIIVLLIIILIT